MDGRFIRWLLLFSFSRLGIRLLVLCALSRFAASAGDAAGDVSALLNFKDTIWFDPLNALATWTKGSTNACSFAGITCDTSGTQRVVDVALSGQRLRGIIRQVIGNLTEVVSFNISYNEFMGDLPPKAFGSMTNLRVLDVSHNLLTGYLPADMAGMAELRIVDFSSNEMVGVLLDFVNATKMQVIDFSNNSLEGTVPWRYAYIETLEALLIGANQLYGDLPQDFGSFQPSLTKFNASMNFFTGPIPKGLSYANLQLFAVNDNQLSGEIPNTATMQKFPKASFLPGNPDLCGPIIEVPCPVPPQWVTPFLATFFTIFALTIAFIIWWRMPPGEYSATTIIRITDDFNNSNLIGVGGLSAVYKGVFPNGRVVVIKRVRPEYYNNDKKNFDWERRRVFYIRHPNLVPVVGSCCTKHLKVLVMEHMINGTLTNYLHDDEGGGSTLSWNSRLEIAGGVAQGLAYLHGEWKSSRCEIKPSSILLDEKFNARITDFRLSKFKIRRPDTDSTEASLWTGYMAPEYLLTRVATPAAEIYGFGTLMLELVTGMKPEATGLHATVKQAFPYGLQQFVLDPKIVKELQATNSPTLLEQINMCTRIGLLCTSELPTERPTMQDVLYMFGQAYAPPRAKLPLPGWVMLALGVSQEDHTERAPWTMVPLPLWLMMLLGLAQDNSTERLPPPVLEL